MSKQAIFALPVVAAVALVGAGLPTDARACGACFHPPTGTAQVTAHEMVVAIGSHQTTLWDQIQYTGVPEEFVWVLPVAPGVEVQLADQAFFDSLERLTDVQMTAPSRPDPCPNPCSVAFGASASGRGLDPAAGHPDVTVYHSGVVGPYETATVGSSDPMALVVWLEDHGYSVPTAMIPTIQAYVEEGLAFAALRLRPGVGVDRMQPVRVTTPGMGLTFPLRMVAGGVQDHVSLELFVIAEGRMETANFPAVEVDPSEITYDYATSAFDYDTAFHAAIDRGDGRGWVTEYSQPLTTLPSVLDTTRGMYVSPDEDLAVVSASFDVGILYPTLTRLRTDLEPRFLDRDVLLQASAGGEVSNEILVTNLIHEPALCPTVCLSTGTGATGTPGGTTTFTTGKCSVSPGLGNTRSAAPLAVLAELGALGLAVRRRRR